MTLTDRQTVHISDTQQKPPTFTVSLFHFLFPGFIIEGLGAVDNAMARVTASFTACVIEFLWIFHIRAGYTFQSRHLQIRGFYT